MITKTKKMEGKDEWISIKTPPVEAGQYECKNDECEFPCFYIHNLAGNLVWLKVSEILEIKYWRFKK